MNFLNWLNGKKTLIGAIIDFIVGVIALAQTSFGFQVIAPVQLVQLHDLALVVITIGLAHKAVKSL